jgi:hypothetical protein
MNGLQRLGRILQGAHFVLLALALSAAPLNAAIPNIPPAMVAQLKNMSPAQQALWRDNTV